MSTVRLYASYWSGKFFPHTAGSSVSSVSSTTRKNGLRSSVLCEAIFMSSAISPNAATKPSTTMPSMRLFMCVSLRVSRRRVTNPAVTANARERRFFAAMVDHLHDVLVAVPARRLRHLAIGLSDENGFVEAAGREFQRMIEAVTRLD